MPLTPLRRYRLLAQVWSVAFVVTGLEFALIPKFLSTQMHVAAGMLGLSGHIDLTPGSLWHIIALSLMVAVTMLAWQTARRPSDRGPYITLQIAKIASTLMFLFLAATQGGIWLLCALTDGSIALTLFLARRSLPQPQVVPGFARAALPSPGYEVWYAKIDVGAGQALWLRHTLLDAQVQECATWALFFDGDRIHAGKQIWPLAAAQAHGVGLLPAQAQPGRFANQHTVFQVADSHLDDANALGSAGEVRWDLHWRDQGQHFEHTPWLLRRLGLVATTFRSPLADLRVNGTVQVGDKVFPVQDATGALGHLHGRRHAQAWAWTHCNRFDGGEDAVFEAISARVRLLGRVTPPLSSFILRLRGQTWTFSSLRNWPKTTTTWGEGVWRFTAENKDVRIEGELRAPDPQRVAMVTYTDTDGSKLWCANSKLAALTLHVDDLQTGERETLVATQTAAFEEVDRRPPQRAITL
jgi:hypothetical protein